MAGAPDLMEVGTVLHRTAKMSTDRRHGAIVSVRRANSRPGRLPKRKILPVFGFNSPTFPATTVITPSSLLVGASGNARRDKEMRPQRPEILHRAAPRQNDGVVAGETIDHCDGSRPDHLLPWPPLLELLLLAQFANVRHQQLDLACIQRLAERWHLVFPFGNYLGKFSIRLFLNLGCAQITDVKLLSHGRFTGAVGSVAHGTLCFEERGSISKSPCPWAKLGVVVATRKKRRRVIMNSNKAWEISLMSYSLP